MAVPLRWGGGIGPAIKEKYLFSKKKVLMAINLGERLGLNGTAIYTELFLRLSSNIREGGTEADNIIDNQWKHDFSSFRLFCLICQLFINKNILKGKEKP